MRGMEIGIGAGIVRLNLAGAGLAEGTLAGAAGAITNNNFYLSATYPFQSETDLASDVRLMELMSR